MISGISRALAFAVLAAGLLVQFHTAPPDRERAIASDPDLSGATDAQNIALNVQIELVSQGFDPGPIDGVPGARTREAIRAYRKWKGVPGDDGVTRDLLSMLSEGK